METFILFNFFFKAQAEIIRLIEKENRCRNKARETLKKFNQKRVAARNSICKQKILSKAF